MKRRVLTLLLVMVCFAIIYNKFTYDISIPVNAKGYIKWVDFNITKDALNDTMKADIESYGNELHYSWIELLSALATGNGGDFSRYKTKQLNDVIEKLKNGNDYTQKKYYSYYYEAYNAVLGGMVGEYIFDGESKYGLKVYSPIAEGYYYNHFDDFGASRSYGYRRPHLGHDLLGGVGTPIIAVESGYVEAAGWNQYGGWRIGIRSFDSKRYYYYAHLRKNHPYNDIYEGKIVNAGEVIGYLGMTGYSTKENINNIDVPHLHYGMQLIFDSTQKDGDNQIWIDMYEITKFLESHRSTVQKNETLNDYFNVHTLIDCNTPD